MRFLILAFVSFLEAFSPEDLLSAPLVISSTLFLATVFCSSFLEDLVSGVLLASSARFLVPPFDSYFLEVLLLEEEDEDENDSPFK